MRSGNKAGQKSVEVRRRNQVARKQASISRGGNVRWYKVLKKDRDGGEEGLPVVTRVWTLCELLVTVRRAPRLLGGSVSVELSMRWREEGKLGNAEWLRCLGGLVCLVLYWMMEEGGKRQAKLARQKEQRRRMTRKIGFVRRDGPAWRTDFRKAVAFLAVSPPKDKVMMICYSVGRWHQ